MRTVIIAGVLCLMVVNVYGFCQIKLEPVGSHQCTASDGTTVQYNDTYRDSVNCMECRCSSTVSGSLSLRCCGYGRNAGVVAPPPGCKVVTGSDGCSMKLVLASDVTKDCVTSIVG